MRKIKIKEGASLQGLNIVMRKVLKISDYLYEKYNQQLVITCGTDGEHSPGSLHYYGYAVDLRTRFFTEEEKLEISSELTKLLGNDYKVIVEPTHFHVEYDLAKINRDQGTIHGTFKFGLK